MRWAIIITLVLFIIPFFWLKPGEMDLGGDSNRLYYYDPGNFLLNESLYFNDFVLEGKRSLAPHFYIIPFVLVLWAADALFNSPYILISISNGIKVSIAFLSVFLIIRSLIHHAYKDKNELLVNLSAILGGLLYITAPIIIGNYEKALITHDQVFLNPLLFYLLLKYFLQQNFRYLVIGIIFTILYSSNFSWAAAPPLFSFYPLAILYLLIYIKLIQKKKIFVHHILISLLLFLGSHAFHLFSEVRSLLNPGSGIHERVFDKDNMLSQINYFYGVLPLAKISQNLFLYLPFKYFPWLGFIPVLFVILGFILNRTKNKTYILTGLFFLLTLYLVSANITNAGVKLYELFFYIPGFSMFRNFIGQWAFVFTFFYAILFGQAVYLVFKVINIKLIKLIVFFIITIAFTASAWDFFTGRMVNTVHYQSNNVVIPMVMNPKYEQTLNFIRSLEDTGSFISFPFTDCCYTVIPGTNNGAYVGPSPLTALIGRKDYNGYVSIAPFSDVFLKFAKNKDYDSIKRLFNILNIKYIYYNADPKVYDSTFAGYPYGTTRQYFPQSQQEYKNFITNIAGRRIFETGYYQIYEVDKFFDSSHISAAKKVQVYRDDKNDWYGKNMSFFMDNYEQGIAYTEKEACVLLLDKNNCKNTTKQFPNNPRISYKKINPSKYIVTVKNANEPYVLVFAETYHESWDIYLKSDINTNFINELTMQPNIKERQLLLNGYANGWYITPDDVNNKSEYQLIIEMSDQRIFYYGVLVSIFTIIISIIVAFFLSRR